MESIRPLSVAGRIHATRTFAPSHLHGPAGDSGHRRADRRGTLAAPRAPNRQHSARATEMDWVQRTIRALGIAAGTLLLVTAAVLAAGPHGNAEQDRPRDRDVVADVVGLTHDQIRDLRHDGLSLAGIAERQGVDPDALVEALREHWAERISARVEAGALTEAAGAELLDQLETQARHMVFRTTLGGQQGAAVGAGPGSGQGGSTSRGAAADGAGSGGGRGRDTASGEPDPRGPRHGQGHQSGQADRAGRP